MSATWETAKPPRLKPGDRVAVVAPSAGIATVFPPTFRRGIENLQRLFQLDVVEMPTTRMAPGELYANPQLRADELNEVFADTQFKGIVATIGGEESVRVLPFLDTGLAKQNPKVFLGYSDITTFQVFYALGGLTTFYGPTVMAGLAQIDNYEPAFAEHVHRMLFEETTGLQYPTYRQFSHGYRDWSNPEWVGLPTELLKNTGPRVVSGDEQVVKGQLFGGCMEVLEMLKATPWWPSPEFWKGKVLFLETSEESPKPNSIKRWLRNYGSMGALRQVSALLFGRPSGYSEDEALALDDVIRTVVVDELGLLQLPVMSGLSFGHTDPQWVMPYGAMVEVNVPAVTLTLCESATS